MTTIIFIRIKEEKKNEILNEIKADYDKSTTPYYAASRLWVDAIIDPAETRKIISMGIDAANHAPIKEDFRFLACGLRVGKSNGCRVNTCKGSS